MLKSAEETPLSALRLGEIITEAGFPAGVVNILTGPGTPTSAALTRYLRQNCLHRLNRGRP
jgi:acyl-CoA reductase-like NAD-dependent aldehyde dehydrogenase